MFKVGNKVRVLRHRNFHGGDLSFYSDSPVGTVTTLKEIDESMSTDDFVMFTIDSHDGLPPWLIRSDDIEHAGPVQLVPRVIPGTYGKVRVTEGGYVHCKSMKTAEEIRDTIATLEQIVEALDETD